MSQLLRDRYYEHAPDRAWDLATGDEVRLDVEPETPQALPLESFTEVLDHGREGMPRWIVAAACEGRGTAPIVRAAADLANARGYVAMAVDAYLRLRTILDADLRDRALLLIAEPSVALAAARAALTYAAAGSPRPHVLLSFMLTGTGKARPTLVREARAVYGAAAARPAIPLPDDVTRQLARAARAPELVRSGRHAAAERLLRDVAAALARRRAWTAAADGYIVLGRVLLERGRALAADAAFGEAADLAHEAKHEPLASSARIWQAAARTDAGHLTAAEALCRAVLLAGQVDDAERARAEATLARVLVWQGRADEAMSLAFLQAAHVSTPFVEATAVRVLLERAEHFEAGQRCRRLLDGTAPEADPLAKTIGLTAHLRVLAAAGDLSLARRCLSEIEVTARSARVPLRLLRARLVWAGALHRAGRSSEAGRESRRLERMRAAAPPLLRSAIDRIVGDASPAVGRPPRGMSIVPTGAIELVAIVQREEADGDALGRLCQFTAEALGCSRADLWSVDAGPPTIVVSAGSGLATQLGERTLEAGIAIGPETVASGHELGLPVRLGTRLVAALVLRWPADAAPPAGASELGTLAAAIAAPRADAMIACARERAAIAASVPELVGTSAAMTEVRKAIARAAVAPFAVMLEGESGVGKELVARALHQLGPRRERRFCDVNCAALPDELLESELFGHARGAFTGAIADRPGLFEDADGGTLFLDEVIELSARGQAKLLRVLQQQEVRRVGETFSRKVDVRIISAANRELRSEASAGRFRQDLLYRLDVIRIRIPPLRERPDDVPLLAVHFWRTASARVGSRATLSHGVLAALARHPWPGNVRELQNVLAALAVEAPAHGTVRAALLPAAIAGSTAVSSGRLSAARMQFERQFIQVALARAGGSRSRAARELGLSRQGLLKLMARLGLGG